MIAQTTDKFPPEQVKEKIGLMSVATARATEPANKISLCSSRISTLMGVLEHKCRMWVQPGLTTTIQKTISMMITSMAETGSHKDTEFLLIELQKYMDDLTTHNIEKKIKYMPIEGLELLQDYNVVVECRARWKEASDMYMANKDAWSVSNKMIADIGDKLEAIELKYNLIIMPKNYSYDINDLNMFNKNGDEKNE
jgi:hypothetical protein